MRKLFNINILQLFAIIATLIAYLFTTFMLYAFILVFYGDKNADTLALVFLVFSVFTVVAAKLYHEQKIVRTLNKVNNDNSTSFLRSDSILDKLFFDKKNKKVLVVDGNYIKCADYSFIEGYAITHNGESAKIKLSLNDRTHPYTDIHFFLDRDEGCFSAKILDGFMLIR